MFDVSAALLKLLTELIPPHLSPEAMHQPNAFRQHCCYTEEVCNPNPGPSPNPNPILTLAPAPTLTLTQTPILTLPLRSIACCASTRRHYAPSSCSTAGRAQPKKVASLIWTATGTATGTASKQP